jgi:hypothetical protein
VPQKNDRRIGCKSAGIALEAVDIAIEQTSVCTMIRGKKNIALARFGALRQSRAKCKKTGLKLQGIVVGVSFNRLSKKGHE